MKIVKEDAGLLTNFEVLDFLRSRGAAKDPTKVLAPIKPSEFKVYDYLEKTPASSQTRESIAEFVTKAKRYKLTNTEMTSIINIRPTTDGVLDPLIEDIDTRVGENVGELVELINQLFPGSHDQSKSDESENKET